MDGYGGSVPPAEVWLKSHFQTILHTSLFSVGHGLLYIYNPFSTQTHRWHGSFGIVHVSGRGFWGSSQEICLA